MSEHPYEHEEMVSEEEMAAAQDPSVGTGSPETAPLQAPPTTLLQRQPAAMIGSAVASVDAGIIVAPLPEWLTLVLTVIVTLAGALGIRAQVTPGALPRDDEGNPLVPHDPS